MRVRFLTLLVVGVTGLAMLVATPAGAAPTARATAADDSDFVLSTTQPGGPGQAPMFVGNGYLAGRQPFEGQGFAEVQLPGRTEPLSGAAVTLETPSGTQTPPSGSARRPTPPSSSTWDGPCRSARSRSPGTR